jgi:exosome complex protein LRP1
MQPQERIRQYFEKISLAESPETSACIFPTMTRTAVTVQLERTTIDKDAAERFIKHAIAQSKFGKDQKEESELTPGPSTVGVPVKVTSKMRERAEYQEELKRADAEEGSDDEVLGIFDQEEEENREAVIAEPGLLLQGRKRRRQAVDFLDTGALICINFNLCTLLIIHTHRSRGRIYFRPDTSDIHYFIRVYPSR